MAVIGEPATRDDNPAQGAEGRATPPRRTRLTRPLLALGAVLVVFVALATTVAVTTPAYENPDEPGHVFDVESLVSGHWYGIHTSCVHLAGWFCPNELHQAPLYYLVMAGWQDLVGLPAQPRYTGSSVIFHGLVQYRAHSTADLHFLLWLRLANVALGALTVAVTFLAIRRIATDPWTPVVAAAVVGFWPRFVFLSAFVTNDNLVNLLGAVLVYALLRFAQAPTKMRIAVAGVVFGLLVTTKLSVLPLGVAFVPVAFLVSGWGRRAAVVATGLGSALGVSAWYLIQNAVRYGDPLARSASSHYLVANGGLGTWFTPYRVTDPLGLVIVRVPEQILRSAWTQSSWNNFHWSTPVNLLILGLVVASVAGMIGRPPARGVLLVLVSVTVGALLCIWVTAFQTASYQARYALVGVAAIAGLMALGLERWPLGVRWAVPALGAVGTVLAIYEFILAVPWT